MKSEDHQDIIKEMADRLREHSVPYKEGAWERFKEVEKKKPKYLVLWPYLSAAAAILIAVILFLKPEENSVFVKELVKQGVERNIEEKQGDNKERAEQKIESLNAKGGTREEVVIVTAQTKVKTQTEAKTQTEVKTKGIKENTLAFEPNKRIIENEKEQQPIYLDEEKAISNPVNTTSTESPLASSNAKETKNPVGFLESLLTIEEKEGLMANKEIDKKWSVGINVSPNISSSRQLNMGGGVALAYSVSPKISLSSGVSYLQLDAERMPHASSQMGSPQMDFPSSPHIGSESPGGVYLGTSSRVKTLNRTEANLIGLDIPLSINYHVSKKFYASAGVSVFNVLNEERINQYENQEVNVSYSGAENKTPEPMIRTFYSSEVANEKLYEGKNLSGFFNFSVGYSIPISKKVGLSIEPFLKVPMSSMGEGDMNLRNGGIKIGTRF